jgi:hypothetical protein
VEASAPQPRRSCFVEKQYVTEPIRISRYAAALAAVEREPACFMSKKKAHNQPRTTSWCIHTRRRAAWLGRGAQTPLCGPAVPCEC